ncbi:amino acid adenylation domain-containing protein [Chitinophaga eiseniae]|uniref:Amino acid adenylation domain-containing protein n=1 Tax=Chitinophaga eiseniae TaxID=634771 RepID=A0A1T4U2C6_9BACT|nr:condensation domain-containing protein [Chitinophaga eiseniae]SKA46699.1 amino acid adenylation domain-containing protein [Chitinophaga eiseniae]
MQTYRNWIKDNQRAVNVLLENELDYWLAQLDLAEAPFPTEKGTVYTATINTPFNNSFNGTELQNRGMAALLFSLYQLTNTAAQVIFREGHGRTPLGQYDVSDAVGWFTCKYPTRYNVVPDSLHRTLDMVTAANNAVPNGGVGFDVLKYYGPVYINRQLECPSGILFNYLGDLTFTGNTDTGHTKHTLFQSPHSGFSSTMESSRSAEGTALFKMNVNAWCDSNTFYCSLDIAPSLGLDAESCKRLTEHIQHHLNELLSGSQAAVKGKVTPFQRGLISYAFNHPESNSYINQNCFESSTEISFAFFREVCKILTVKYEILRTCYEFDYQTGNFASTLLPAGTLSCAYHDLSDANPQTALPPLLKQIKHRGFRINEEPLIRFSLVKIPAGKNIIVITSHHIIIDGTSVMYLLKELLNISSDLQAGKPVATSISTAHKFSTYADWIASKNEADALRYWKDLLAGATASLPEDKTTGEPEAAENSFADAAHHFSIHPDTAGILKEQHLTQAAALNYMVGFVMSKYNGTDTFVWGNTVTVRPFELDDMETIVGPCIATVPVKMNFNTDDHLVSAMKSLQLQLMESQEHAYVALNDINRCAGQQQLFSVTYVYQNFLKSELDEQQSGPFQSHFMQDNNISSHFPINILVYEGDRELSIRVKYRKDLFTGQLINDICQAVGNLFNNLQVIQELPVKDIDIFSICALKGSSLQGEYSNVEGITLHNAFMEAAERYPEKTAVRDVNNSVSYRELDHMSNRICRLLMDRNISGAVGIRMKRTANLIAVIIGILKSGCHVVSLEHDFPDEKIDWIHRNIGLAAVFTDEGTYLNVDTPAFSISTIAPLEKIDKLPYVDPSALCCINYTSGSTGVPKLVKINHTGHVNRVLWLAHCFPATAEDVYGFKTLLCFGPSMREVFEPLMQGSTLFVYTNESNNHPALFHEQTLNYRVTRLFLTPTFIRLLHEVELQDTFSALRYLEISGEPIAVELFDKLRSAFPAMKTVGRYGATEAPGTVYYTYDAHNSKRNLPLGQPIRNTGVAVLNEQGGILPTGVIGEIAISGESISTGYINRELEKGNFIIVNGKPHVKTGDLGYVNAGGILVFQSRKTRMLKIRGFRVEPAEIEANLMRHPGIKKSIVVPVVSKNNTRLTAFYIKKEAAAIQGLRAFLEERLPPYMIPHEFTEISKIPLTESGKVDYVGLSNLATTHSKGDLKPPATGIEKDVFEIVSDLIDHREFDVLSNFVEIGMDSILALKTIYKIRKSFNTDIVVSDLYMRPTVKELSAFIEKRMQEGPGEEAPCHLVNDQENNDLLFFVPPIGNSQIDIKTLENAVPPNITLAILQPVNADDVAALSIEKIAADYIAHIRKIAQNRSVHISGWSLGGTIAYEIAVQLERDGFSIAHLLLFDPGLYTPAYDHNMTRDKLEQILSGLAGQDLSADKEIKEKLLTDMLHANQLIVNYQPSAYSGAVHLFKPTDIGREERNFGKEMNGLEQYCKGTIHVTRLAGNHISMLNDIQRNRQIMMEFVGR